LAPESIEPGPSGSASSGAKKIRIAGSISTASGSDIACPKGLVWDCVNHSCAYDSVFTILYNVWVRDQVSWSRRLRDISEILEGLVDGFSGVENGQLSLEAARNSARERLHRIDNVRFPTGSTPTSIDDLCHLLFNGRRTCRSSSLACSHCGLNETHVLLYFGEYIRLTATGPFHDDSHERSFVSDVMGWHLSNRQKRSNRVCPSCYSAGSSRKLSVHIHMNRMPYMLCVLLQSPRFNINTSLSYTSEGVQFEFKLQGVIYCGGSHFVSRYIDLDGVVWYHDGITTASKCVREAHINSLPDEEWLRSCSRGGQQKMALMAIYTR